MLSQKKQTATVVLQLICLLAVFTSHYYLRGPILWSVLFISLVSHLQSHQCQFTTGSFQSHQHLEERNISYSQV